LKKENRISTNELSKVKQSNKWKLHGKTTWKMNNHFCENHYDFAYVYIEFFFYFSFFIRIVI
jgi:beta-lactamase class D